jgi:hypothetical protein
MSFLIPSLPKKVFSSIHIPSDSEIDIEHARQIIFAILIIGTGLITLAPVLLQSPRVIYLPPVTSIEHDYYAQKIHDYSEQATQPAHTQADALRLADALANIGEREAATEAYLQAMSDYAKP